MAWLDQFLLAIRSVASGGVALPQRGTLNFSGGGVVVSDDEANDRIDVVIAGGGGGISALTGDVDASGSGSVVATVQGIQGVGVASSAPTSGQVLAYDAGTTLWTPATPAAALTALTGDVTASGPGSAASTVARIQGVTVDPVAPSNGQVLTYSASGSKWMPVTPGGGAVKSINIQGTNAYGTIAAGTPVAAWSTSDGAVVPAVSAWGGSYNSTYLAPIGIATNTTTGGGTVEICAYGECTLPAGIASNATPVFVAYGANTVVPFGSIGAAGPYRVIRAGTMISDTKLFVQFNDLGTVP